MIPVSARSQQMKQTLVKAFLSETLKNKRTSSCLKTNGDRKVTVTLTFIRPGQESVEGAA